MKTTKFRIILLLVMVLLAGFESQAQDYSPQQFASDINFSGKITYLNLDTVNLIATGKIVSPQGEKYFSYDYSKVLKEANVDNFFIKLQTLNDLMFCFQNRKKLTLSGVLNNNQVKVSYVK